MAGCDPYPCYYYDAFGCYGYAKTAAVTKKSKKLKVKSYSGSWSVKLDYQGGNCPYNGDPITGDPAVRQNNNSVVITLSRYGSFRGRKTSKGFTVTGHYTPKGSLCNGEAEVVYTSKNARTGNVKASVDVSCLGRYVCSSNFSGAATKN